MPGAVALLSIQQSAIQL